MNVREIVKTYLNFFDAACSKYLSSDDTNDAEAAAYFEEQNSILSKGQDSVFNGEDEYGCVSARSVRFAQGGTAAYAEYYSDIYGSSDSSSASKSTNMVGDIDVATASYYIRLYRAIKNNGWKRCDQADNKDYLETQLKNAAILICTVDNDGNLSYISLDSTDSPLHEQDDDEAQQRAKAEYESTKDEINYKETILDTEQKTLDTELEEIKNIIDSTKNIIKNNIEKFKMFEA